MLKCPTDPNKAKMHVKIFVGPYKAKTYVKINRRSHLRQKRMLKCPSVPYKGKTDVKITVGPI